MYFWSKDAIQGATTLSQGPARPILAPQQVHLPKQQGICGINFFWSYVASRGLTNAYEGLLSIYSEYIGTCNPAIKHVRVCFFFLGKNPS